jgi:thiol-disulfide isomerase/thioredoxin
LTVLCAFVRADTRGPAPQFTAQTLDGETFTNAPLSGTVTLLQFWVTWCPCCRRDQSAVDNIERVFADKRLMVLAVDVGESETTVRTYPQGNPRSCRVVVNEGAKLGARFGAHGFSYYVLIVGEGNIAGTQGGADGEA